MSRAILVLTGCLLVAVVLKAASHSQHQTLEGDIEALKIAVSQCRENYAKLQTWQGLASLDRVSGHGYSDRWHLRVETQFVHDREHNKSRWRSDVIRTHRQARTDSVVRRQWERVDQLELPYGTLSSSTQNHNDRNERVLRVSRQNVQPHTRWPEGFDAIDYLSRTERVWRYYDRLNRPEADIRRFRPGRVEREGDIVRLFVDTEEAREIFHFDLAQSGAITFFEGDYEDRQEFWRAAMTESNGVWLPTHITHRVVNKSNGWEVVADVRFMSESVNAPIASEAFDILHLDLKQGMPMLQEMRGRVLATQYEKEALNDLFGTELASGGR